MAAKKTNFAILAVDDAPDTLEILQRNLAELGFTVFTAFGVEEALRVLERTSVDLVITDLKMPRHNGLELVRHVRENLHDTEVIMITGYPSIEGAVEAVKTGAEEYLPKPFTGDELEQAVRRATDKLELRRAVQEDLPATDSPFPGILGRSPTMRAVFRATQKAAAVSATTLITGESGTGKDLIARAIHYNSARASAPFVPVNCGGIPESLLESVLFGHVKGAFTGATETRAGFFQTADGGTIFLDEIGETSLTMQVKLLRVLQDKTVSMVGSNRTTAVDVRILAATNKDPLSLVRRGLFREDLFYRLNVVVIHIPPLRKRGDDVLLLTGHYLDKYSAELGKPPPTLTDRALQVLRSYAWPGNVRELQNVIQRVVVMTERDQVDAPDLPSLMRFSVPRGTGLLRTLAEMEGEHIRHVMEQVAGNKTRAAEILGIDRKTLREKLKKHNNPA